MPSSQSGTRERTRHDLREPDMYRVIMHNDDFTTMEFVVMVLKAVFRKSEIEANNLMLTVHRSGRACVGLYTYDIASTKAARAMQLARDAGYPFKLTVEPDEKLPF